MDDPRQIAGPGINPYSSPANANAPTPAPPQDGGKALAAFILGLIGLLAWCLPIVGLPLSITGLILGLIDINSSRRGMAIAGVVLSALCLLLSIANAAAGVYLALNKGN